MASPTPSTAIASYGHPTCLHKPAIGCVLTALPVCCACADQRPMAAAYAVYIDGQGMKLQGKRWQRYCWKCRDHWNRCFTPNTEVLLDSTMSIASLPDQSAADASLHPSQDSVIAHAQSSSWSFTDHPFSRTTDQQLVSNENTAATVSHHTPQAESSEPQGSNPDHLFVQAQQGQPPIRRPLINPFGTREEIESEDYQSPLAGMFTRAWNRYRDAEVARREEQQQQDQYESRPEPLDSNRPVDSTQANENTTEARYAETVTHSELASAFSFDVNVEPAQAEIRINPIDGQQRPTPLKLKDMLISIACKICNEQKIDTLLEPCMHVAICRWCSEILRQEVQLARRSRALGHQHQHLNQWKCPVCRRDIHGVRRIYLG